MAKLVGTLISLWAAPCCSPSTRAWPSPTPASGSAPRGASPVDHQEQVPDPHRPIYAGIIGCGVSFLLLTWCIEKRGPVFIAAFIPVVQIIVSVIDFCILHEQLYVGSVLGSVLVIGGLYLLLWGKRQEALHCPPKDTTEDDKERNHRRRTEDWRQHLQF